MFRSCFPATALTCCLLLTACGSDALVEVTEASPTSSGTNTPSTSSSAPSTSTSTTAEPDATAPPATTEPIVADWSAPLAITVGETARFSNDSSGPFVDAAWDFGDGTASETIDAEQTYLEPGVYTVTLTVTDGDTSSTFSRNVVVDDAPRSVRATTTLAPVPTTTMLPATGGVRGTVTLQSGNCMPTIIDDDAEPPPSCATGPASVELAFHPAIEVSASIKSSTPIATVRSDAAGSYQVSLPPGLYSVIPTSPDPTFPGCSTSDGVHHCPLTITAGSTVTHDIVVVNAVF